MLEERILLSGDSPIGALPGAAPDNQESMFEMDSGLPPLEEVLISADTYLKEPSANASESYDPSQGLDDIFSGLTEEDPFGDGEGVTSDSKTSPYEDSSISKTQKEMLTRGLKAVDQLGRVLEDFNEFGAVLPLTENASLGGLLGLSEILDTRLNKPVFDYFNDAVDPPNTEGVLGALNEISGESDDLTIALYSLDGGFAPADNEVRFDLKITATRKGEVRLDATEETGVELDLELQVEAAFIATLELDYTFGVDQDSSDEFFITIRQFEASLVMGSSAPDSDLISANSEEAQEAESGAVEVDAQVSVEFDKTIAEDGRITLTELDAITPETIDDFVHLAAAGTLNAEFRASGGDSADDNGPTFYIYRESANLFGDDAPEVAIKIDITHLKEPILEMLKELSELGGSITASEVLNANLPVIESSINQLFSDNPDVGLGNVLDFYTPALSYFTLLEVFNFDLTDQLNLSRIGALPGIDIANFDLENVAHRNKLKNLMESEYDLNLGQDWDINLYLPEIWSLLDKDFQINEYLPQFQLLLGLPYVPNLNEIRSDIKSHFDSFPSLKGLLDYIRTVTLDPLYSDFEGRIVAEPFNLSGDYFPDTNELRFDFLFDGVKESAFAVDLESLFADQFNDQGVSIDSEMAFTLALDLALDFSVGIDLGQSDSPTTEDVFVSVRQSSVTIEVNEDIDGLAVSVEDFPGSSFAVSEGRFDFDSRVELVFHGLDPPAVEASGSLSIDLPVASDNPTQPTFYIYRTSDNPFDSTYLESEQLLVDRAIEDDADTPRLTDAQLASTFDYAIEIWRESLSDAALIERLDAVTAVIDDLTGRTLGETTATNIVIDATAAGHGWFVDATPADSSEFDQTDAAYFVAAVGSEAVGHIDLLTVVLHEIGHVLGFDHDSGLALMTAQLGEGERFGLMPDAGAGESGTAVSSQLVSGTAPNLILDLTPAADDATNVTVTVFTDGSIDISGSAGDDPQSPLAGVVEIRGNASGSLTIVGPNVDTLWNLDGLNSGTLTFDVAGTPTTISFSNVTTITGGSAADEFRVGSAYTLAVDINGGDGNDSLTVETGANLAISFDGGIGNADTIVNEDGNVGGVTDSNVETFIDRPLLFIPGFAGTFANTSLADDPAIDGNGPLEEWFLNRGIDPTRLILEPLMEAYSDIVQSFANIGYTNGTNDAGVDGTLYEVLWDWRVPVAQADAVTNNNGILDDVSVASLIDATFDTALDYLSYFMEQAVNAWTALTGGTPDAFDVVTHSTGGLVAKSYIQSAAYDEAKGPGSEHLLPINMLIQTGVPNQGTGAPYAFLNNDFSLKVAARLLAKILKDAYDYYIGPTTAIKNPDGSTLTAATPVEFIARYIETLENLLATYDFLDVEDASAVLTALTTADSVFNYLLTDLNAYSSDAFVARGQLGLAEDILGAIVEFTAADADVDGFVTMAELLALHDAVGNGGNGDGILQDSEAGALAVADRGDDLGGTSPDGILSYSELLRFYDRQTFIVYSDGVDTPDIAIEHTGPVPSLGLANEILPFESTLVGSLPGLTQTWYELQNHPSGGDGTVSALSASAGFANARLVEVTALAGEDIEHTGITHNEISQRKIIELLGVTNAAGATISTSLLLSQAQSAVRLIQLGVVDPIELVVDLYNETSDRIDGLWTAANSKLNAPLPIINQSISELIGVELPGLGLNEFVSGLVDKITAPSSILTVQNQLDAIEGDIETALGLGAGELILTSAANFTSSGIFTIGFDISRQASTAFNIDLSNSGPLSGVIPVTLSAGMSLEFNITLSLGDLVAFAGLETGANGLSFELVDFTVFADLSASGIDLAVGYDGLGSLGISGGTINFRAEVNTRFYDPDQIRQGIPFPAEDADQTVSFLDLITAGNTPLNLLKFDTSNSAFSFSLPININADNAVVDFNGDGQLLINSTDIFAGGLPSIGVSLGTLGSPASVSVDDFLYFEGVFSIEYRVGDLWLASGSSGTLRSDVGHTVISAAGVSAFVGINGPYVSDIATPDAIGISITSLDFTLLMFADQSSGFNYTALKTTNASGSLVGTGLSLTMTSLSANLNTTSDTGSNLVIDFNAGGIIAGTPVTAVGPTIDFEGESGPLFDVAGAMEIDIGGFVVAAGNFVLTQRGGITINDGSGDLTGDLLMIRLSSAHLFVGMGAGAFQYDSTNKVYTGIDTTDAIGFLVSGASLDLAMFGETAGAMRNWTGIAAHVDLMTVVGINPAVFTLTLQNLDLLYNVADTSASPAKLNWDALSDVGANPAIVGLGGLTATLDLKVSGSLALGIGSFVKAAGSVEFTQQSGLTLNDGSALGDINADVLMIRLSAVHLFVGMGAGAFQYDSTNKVYTGIDTTDAIGFLVSGASLDLALVNERTGAKRNWTGIAAHVDLMTVVGINPAVFTLTLQNLDLLYNVAASGDNSKLDWNDLTNDNVVLGLAGLDASLDLKVSGSLALGIGSFVKAAGSVEFTQQSGLTLNDGSALGDINADVLMIRLSAVHLFVGMGAGAFQYDSTNKVYTGIDTTDAIGFKVAGASLDLALVNERTGAKRNWTGIAAHVDLMTVVGIDPAAFVLEVRNLDLLYNVAASGDNSKLDWNDLTNDNVVLGLAGLDASLDLKVRIRDPPAIEPDCNPDRRRHQGCRGDQHRFRQCQHLCRGGTLFRRQQRRRRHQ